MNTVLNDPTVRDYLSTLDRLLERAPDRALIVDGVAQHIDQALAGSTDPARVQSVLHELGDPADIAAESAGLDPASASERAPFLQRRAGAVLTVLLLTVGAVLVPIAGWIAGLGLLWFSKGWTVGDKILGTVVPAVLGAALLGVSAVTASASPVHHLALIAGLALGAIVIAVHLLRRFREPVLPAEVSAD